MAKSNTWSRKPAIADDEHATTAEDAALVLSLVIIVVLSGTLVTFLLLEFLDVLPARIGSILLATLFIFCGVVGRALLSRALSYPHDYKGEAPVMRNLGRSRRSRGSSVPPIRA